MSDEHAPLDYARQHGWDRQYDVYVPPGRYDVIAHAGMSCEPVRVTVDSGQWEEVDVHCDSGIR